MEAKIPNQVEDLKHYSREQLVALWKNLFKRPLPSGLRREIVVPLLAYKIQEVQHGGLKAATRHELRRLARSFEKGSSEGSPKQPRQIKIGTRLARDWQGETHEVAVVEGGFEYRGTRYKSLSKIACQIAGTRWSGPAFFGLNKKTSAAAVKSR